MTEDCHNTQIFDPESLMTPDPPSCSCDDKDFHIEAYMTTDKHSLGHIFRKIGSDFVDLIITPTPDGLHYTILYEVEDE